MHRTAARFVLVTGVLLAMVAVASTSAGTTSEAVVAPNGTLYGAPYGEWLGRWTAWAVTPPTATNPIVNPKDCKITPQPGERVWYLTASAGGKRTQSCTIPSGRAIFVPITGTIAYSETPKDTFAYLRPQAVATFEQTTVLEVSIDGRPVPGLRAYRSVSRNLVIPLPKANIFQIPAGPTRFVDAFYGLLVTGLLPGMHTIVTYAEIRTPGQPVFKAGMTYRITIA